MVLIIFFSFLLVIAIALIYWQLHEDKEETEEKTELTEEQKKVLERLDILRKYVLSIEMAHKQKMMTDEQFEEDMRKIQKELNELEKEYVPSDC